MKGWTETTLGKVADIIPGYAFKGIDFGKYGVPVIKIKNICPPKIDFGNIEYVDIKKYKPKHIEKVRIFKNDFVVAMTGATIGKIGKMYSSEEAYINQRVAKICPKNFVDWNYIYYNINSSEFYQHIQNNIDSHSAQENISTTSIGRYSLQLPSLDEQRAIAAVLSSLDDKIDLLHRQNATLEAMAEALFRQWFVVEAKEEWEHGFLPDEFEFVMGQSPNGHSFNEIGMGTPMFQGNADFGFRFPSARIYTTEPTRFAQKFDTLISVRAPVGAQNMAQDRCCIGRGLAAFRYKNNSSFYSYAYFKLRYLLKEILVYNDEGTVFGSISKNDFNKIEIIIPDYNSVSEFENMILSINNKVISNCQQINTLEKLRDTLLPKLMSGEVRVDF